MMRGLATNEQREDINEKVSNFRINAGNAGGPYTGCRSKGNCNVDVCVDGFADHCAAETSLESSYKDGYFYQDQMGRTVSLS